MNLLCQSRKKNVVEQKESKKLLEHQLAKSMFCGFIAIVLSMWFSETALADFNLDNFGKSIADPAKKAFNDFYAVGILVAGGAGAFLHGQGDFRDRMVGFGKGAAIGGLVVGAVKAGFGI